MVASGIFILPALAVGIAGPAVIPACLVAGVLILPAALSKAAMPESGESHVYIERGIGPLLGMIGLPGRRHRCLPRGSPRGRRNPGRTRGRPS